MGQRSATETLFGLVHAFIERSTWTQAELARRLELGVPALRKRLVELQAAGWPLERDEEGAQVFWSVPKNWIPGALVFKEEEAVELLRQLARLPESEARRKLLEAVTTRLPNAVLGGKFDPSALVPPAFSAAEEEFVPVVENAATRKHVLRFRYFTASRGDEDWRSASVHRLELGSPVRFVATCHRSGTLKWFRVDSVFDARVDPEAPFRHVPPEAVEAFAAESLDGFREQRPPVLCAFFVRHPDAAWVRRNLLKGMTLETVEGGVRVTVNTSAVQRVARFVVGLGDAARPESPELRDAIVAIAEGALAAARGDANGKRSD